MTMLSNAELLPLVIRFLFCKQFVASSLVTVRIPDCHTGRLDAGGDG